MKPSFFILTLFVINIFAQENRVLVPNEKTVFVEASKENIVWVFNSDTSRSNAEKKLYSKVHKLILKFSTDNGKTWIRISDSIDDTVNTFLWQVPNVSSDSCEITIIDKEDLNDYIVSDLFSIKKKTQNDIEITSPFKGDTLTAGDKSSIIWCVHSDLIGRDQVKLAKILFTHDNGVHWDSLKADTNVLKFNEKLNELIYPWIVNDASSDECSVKILYPKEKLCDSSALFTVLSGSSIDARLLVGSTFSFFNSSVQSNNLYDAANLSVNSLWKFPKLSNLWKLLGFLNYIFPAHEPISADFSFSQGKSTSGDSTIISGLSQTAPISFTKKSVQNQIFVTSLSESFNFPTFINFVFFSFYEEFRNLQIASTVKGTLSGSNKDTTLMFNQISYNEIYFGWGLAMKKMFLTIKGDTLMTFDLNFHFPILRGTDASNIVPYGFILKFNIGISPVKVDLGGELRTDHIFFKTQGSTPRFSQLLIYLAKSFDVSKLADYITK